MNAGLCAGGVGHESIRGRLFHDGGGVLAKYIARWDGAVGRCGAGTTAKSLRWRCRHELYAEALHDGGGSAATTLQMGWSSWSALGRHGGRPHGHYVNELAVSGSDLYVAALSGRRAAVRQ